jgi:arylsulfatase A
LAIIILTLLVTGCNSDKSIRPNILLIITDDQGYGDVGYNGNTIVSTPVIDNLAETGIVLNEFYVSPVCAPTRASLLTGKYHLSTGVSWVTHRKEVMSQDEITIAEYLQDKGYRTGLFGKWHNGKQYPHDPIGQGFEKFYGFKDGHINNYFDPILTSNQEEIHVQGYLPDLLIDETISFIDGEEPFFAMVAFNTPHSPFQVPDSYFEKYKAKGLADKDASVYGMVENIDDNIGRLLSALKTTGKTDNTLIIFIGDNGPNGNRYNAGLKGIKSHVDEGGVRVPAIISYPAANWPSGSINGLAAHIDILPTIAEIVVSDYENKVNWDGVSLKRHFEELSDVVKRDFFTHQVVRKFDKYPGAVRRENYLLTLKHDAKQLYDLQADPNQQTDLSQSIPSLVQKLESKYDLWFEQQVNTLGQPELIETGHEGIAIVNLPAPEIIERQYVDFKGYEGWANDYLINFNDSSLIEWKTRSTNDQSYDLELELNSAAQGVINLTIDSVDYVYKLAADLSKTLIPSQDRVKRGEVYGYDWPTIRLGTHNFIKGDHKITLKVRNTKDLEIKSLNLILNND